MAPWLDTGTRTLEPAATPNPHAVGELAPLAAPAPAAAASSTTAAPDTAAMRLLAAKVVKANSMMR
jgi:hypothetical protein